MYLDDMVIFSKDLTSHVKSLEAHVPENGMGQTEAQTFLNVSYSTGRLYIWGTLSLS